MVLVSYKLLKEYRSVKTGLDHRVGHWVSMPPPANQWLDSVKGCTKRAPSPSFAMHFAHDSGLRKAGAVDTISQEKQHGNDERHQRWDRVERAALFAQ